MKRKGFSLVEIVIGLGLLGLLSLVILNAVTTSSVGIVRIERRSIILDQCQRVVETLKLDSEENNDFFDSCIEGDDYVPYPCGYLNDGATAYVKLDHDGERLQTYSVKILWEDDHVELKASRIIP